MPTKTVVLVHGLFVTRHCWDPWVARYEARGYRCISVAYPGRDDAPAALRSRHPDPSVGGLTLTAVLEHHVQVIRSLDEAPILVGHSFGGLLVQLLLQRDLGAAGVAIDSVPPRGVVTTRWSFYRSLLPGLNPLVPVSRPYLMTPAQFAYAFAHTMTPADQRTTYEREVAPESRRLMRAPLTREGRIDFGRARPPLLVIAGELDHIMPAPLNRANAARYGPSPSATVFREFPGRTHMIIGEPGWEEVADFALEWATGVQSSGADRTRAAHAVATTARLADEPARP